MKRPELVEAARPILAGLHRAKPKGTTVTVEVPPGARVVVEPIPVESKPAEPVKPAMVDADWIDQTRSPLGKRKHMALCKTGKFPSAKKVGKKWLVRRAEIDGYIEGNQPQTDDPDEIDRIMTKLGFK